MRKDRDYLILQIKMQVTQVHFDFTVAHVKIWAEPRCVVSRFSAWLDLDSTKWQASGQSCTVPCHWCWLYCFPDIRIQNLCTSDIEWRCASASIVPGLQHNVGSGEAPSLMNWAAVIFSASLVWRSCGLSQSYGILYLMLRIYFYWKKSKTN